MGIKTIIRVIELALEATKSQQEAIATVIATAIAGVIPSNIVEDDLADFLHMVAEELLERSERAED